MNKIEKMAAKAVNTIIDIEIYGWPPICFGTFYQPKRPTEQAKELIRLSKGKASKDKNNL